MNFIFIVILCWSCIDARCVGSRHNTREYNDIEFAELEHLDELSTQYFNHEGQFANNNLFIGVYEPHCKILLDNTPVFWGAQLWTTTYAAKVISLPSTQFPLTLRSCVEIFYYVFDTPISDPFDRTVNLSNRSLAHWILESISTVVRVTNNFDFPVVFGLDLNKFPYSSGVSQSLGPGAESISHFSVGSVYCVRALLDGTAASLESPSLSPIVDYFAVTKADSILLSPFNRLQTCEVESSSLLDIPISCDDLGLRFYAFRAPWEHSSHIGRNFVQPLLMPRVSKAPLGFELRTIPSYIFDWLQNIRFQKIAENDFEKEYYNGIVLNQMQAPTKMIQLSYDQKIHLGQLMLPIVQDWYSGEGKLHITSIYGIRRYENNSVLLMHVDKPTTHVVSVIINIDQEVEQDWPLVILDHDGNEHSVSMAPGDMVLYESSKLVHGRPGAFRGKYYDNIFLHYCPAGEWEYFGPNGYL